MLITEVLVQARRFNMSLQTTARLLRKAEQLTRERRQMVRQLVETPVELTIRQRPAEPFFFEKRRFHGWNDY